MVPPDFRSKALKKSVGVMDRGFGKGLFNTVIIMKLIHFFFYITSKKKKKKKSILSIVA